MFDMLQNIEFDHPWLLGLLLLLPLMAYYQYFYRDRIRPASVKVSHSLKISGKPSFRVQALTYLPILQLLALGFLITAMARPQLALKEEEITAEGIDIIMALDLSSSMLAKDFQPDRLEVSKKVASEFVDKRPDDRIGLVVFSGESFTQCPLTSDHRIVKRFLSQLQCGFLEEGTAIGMGLATAVNRIKDSEAKSKVVILLTDGDNNTGYIKPLTAADMSR
jgi:Ca-activated chloride channel family protein